MTIRIAVDAVGGDNAPEVIVEGVVRAARAVAKPIELILYGPLDQVSSFTDKYEDFDRLPITLVHAPDVIGMAESPAAAVKSKPLSSIHLGLTAHRAGDVSAFVSAGNTGAIMAAALFILGRLPNVSRPSVIGYYPTTQSFSIVIDVGTNVDAKPEHLVQFAKMGAEYARMVLRRPNPSVALMNIGEEASKGNEQIKAAHALMQADESLHFLGNIEGRDLMHHAADVVVCDGFVGNIMLKLGESMATALPNMLKDTLQEMSLRIDEAQLVKRVFSDILKRFDYEEYGAFPLLGVNGNVLIGHGGSTPKAVEQMIHAAAEVSEIDVAGAIAAALG